MKYAVEAKIFDNGKVMARVRLARDGEESGHGDVSSWWIFSMIHMRQPGTAQVTRKRKGNENET